jgi:hypothetical protein
MIDNEDRETELATSLAALVQQIDVNDYRDKKGHGLRNNLAFMKAQELVDRYGFSHEAICGALSRYGDDIAGAAKHLSAT